MQYMLIFFLDENAAGENVFSEMGAFAGGLAQQGKLQGGSPLQPSSSGARVRVQDGKTLLTDGPFTETKEVVAGFFLIDCESRDEAIEHAKRCPHARVGTVEVREVIPVGKPGG